MNKIPIDRILPNPQQPRSAIDEADLMALSDSILEHGLINPIAVEEGTDGYYILIDGERRWRAARLAGLTEIEASVRPSQNGAGEKERLMLAMVANLIRSDLTPIEEGQAYEQLSQMGLSNAEIAHQASTYSSRVANRRALLLLAPEIQELAAKGLIPIDKRAIDAIQSVPEEHRIRLARQLARPGLQIGTVQNSARKLIDALEVQKETDLPSLTFAVKRSGKADLPNWDALHQLGKLPAWELVVKSAHYTCDTCVLRPEASKVVCGECPGVVLISRMIEASNGK